MALMPAFQVAPSPSADVPVSEWWPEDDQVYSGLLIEQCRITAAVAELVEIDDSLLRGVSFGGAELPKLAVTDAVLESCDLAVFQSRDSSWTRVRIGESRLTGLGFTRASLQQVELTDCPAGDSLWRSASLRQVRFRDCQLTGADFAGAQLTQVEFIGCDLAGADFSQARVRGGTTFTDCTFTGTTGLDSLRGAEIGFSDPYDAVALVVPLAAALGLKVRQL